MALAVPIMHKVAAGTPTANSDLPQGVRGDPAEVGAEVEAEVREIPLTFARCGRDKRAAKLHMDFVEWRWCCVPHARRFTPLHAHMTVFVHFKTHDGSQNAPYAQRLWQRSLVRLCEGLGGLNRRTRHCGSSLV